MKRSVVFLATVVAAVAVAGAAFAYFASSGSGSGGGHSGTLSAPTISASHATPTTALLPGGTADVTLELSNPNAVALTVTSVAANGTISVSGGSGCTAGNDGVSFTTQSGLSISVPAHAVNDVIDLPAAITMSSASASGCQGASFNVPVTVTAVH
jgi:hypothetical protein